MDKQLMIKLTHECYWDQTSQTVSLNNHSVMLSSKMRKLLKIFIDHHGKPIAPADFFYSIWDDDNNDYNPKHIRNLISNLRIKLPCLTIVNYYGGRYALMKNEESIPDFKDYLIEILDQAKNGITISDPNKFDNPIIYVNHAFTSLFGYTSEEALDKNCRFLQRDDRDQLALDEIRYAIKVKTDVTVILRNYHKEGQLIYNEVTISPIFDKKTHKLKYFLGVQKDVTSLQKILQQIKGIV